MTPGPVPPRFSDADRAWMREALALAARAAALGEVPVGALVVRAGDVLGRGFNAPIGERDPTAHAEIVAIRAACQALGDFTLRGCQVYTSCEPCPMCLAGLWWARVDTIFYANTRSDAAAIGFDDKNIYQELARAPAERKLPLRQLMRDRAMRAFSAWRSKADRVEY